MISIWFDLIQLYASSDLYHKLIVLHLSNSILIAMPPPPSLHPSPLTLSLRIIIKPFLKYFSSLPYQEKSMRFQKRWSLVVSTLPSRALLVSASGLKHLQEQPASLPKHLKWLFLFVVKASKVTLFDFNIITCTTKQK